MTTEETTSKIMAVFNPVMGYTESNDKQKVLELVTIACAEAHAAAVERCAELADKKVKACASNELYDVNGIQAADEISREVRALQPDPNWLKNLLAAERGRSARRAKEIAFADESHRGWTPSCLAARLEAELLALGPQDSNLPLVAGNVLTTSLIDFERKCQVTLGEEQAKVNPDNHLIGLLSDAVRLSRECALRAQPAAPAKEPKQCS